MTATGSVFTRLWRVCRRFRLAVLTGIMPVMLVIAACLPASIAYGEARAAKSAVGQKGPKAGTNIPAAAAAADPSSPEGQFLTAFDSVKLADWLKEKGMRAEAADLYAEASNLFSKLAADHPQWQPSVVSFRITYCREALKRLQEEGQQTTDDRRRTADDKGIPWSVDRGLPALTPATRMGTSSVERTTNDGKRLSAGPQSEIGNQKSKIPDVSPMDIKLQQAALRERSRDYSGALSIYSALLEEFPREPWALKGATRCWMRLGNMERARALARETLTLPAPDADMYLLAGLVDCHEGRYPEAEALLRQSLKLNGANPVAHVALGVTLAATGQLQEAQGEMKRALSLNPKLGDAYYNLARLSLKQKPTDLDTPRVHYQNALRFGSARDSKLDALLTE